MARIRDLLIFRGKERVAIVKARPFTPSKAYNCVDTLLKIKNEIFSKQPMENINIKNISQPFNYIIGRKVHPQWRVRFIDFDFLNPNDKFAQSNNPVLIAEVESLKNQLHVLQLREQKLNEIFLAINNDELLAEKNKNVFEMYKEIKNQMYSGSGFDYGMGDNSFLGSSGSSVFSRGNR